jgi:hypothetical protein
MRNGKGRDCDEWLMVDENGRRTLFQVVEVAKGAEAVRVASELPARVIVVDIALPAPFDLAAPFDGQPARRSQSGGSRLILLNVRRVSSDDANRAMRITRVRPDRRDTMAPD